MKLNLNIKKRLEIRLSTLNNRMLDHYAKKLIPFATKSILTISTGCQCDVLSRTYVFDTGKKKFFIVHEYLRRFNYEMLDQNTIIPNDPKHKPPWERVHYGDEYFFFDEFPF